MKAAATLGRTDLDTLDFAKGDGLLPVIVQHALSGAVLMLGYMNLEAARATLERRRLVFFSRSKGRLWEKGETSGHYLDLVSLQTDCDRDTLLATALPHGPACHLGTATCFGDAPQSQVQLLEFLPQLEQTIEQRARSADAGSYTARLLAAGPSRIAQKVGEEGVEVALAGVGQSDEKLVGEAADLVFHLMVLLHSRGQRLADVVRELQSRHEGGQTGSK